MLIYLFLFMLIQTHQIVGDDQILDNALRVYTSTGEVSQATQILQEALKEKPSKCETPPCLSSPLPNHMSIVFGLVQMILAC